jgi:hypothetical protein
MNSEGFVFLREAWTLVWKIDDWAAAVLKTSIRSPLVTFSGLDW